MTQLELPQISFARYLELLRRRRWQVIPVSLLGLLVGALVAFFVPRYYVVSTKLQMDGAVLGTQGGSESDPMLGVFEAAKVSIPATVPEVLRELRWREAMTEDFDARIAFEQSVRERIDVQDVTPGSPRGRNFVVTLITYRDTDGRRALQFIEKLRDRWLENERARLLQSWNRENDGFLDRYHAAARARDQAETELRLYEAQNGLNPEDFGGTREGNLSARTAAVLELGRALTDRRVRLRTLEAQRENLTSRIQATPPRIETRSTEPVDPTLAAEQQRLTAQYLMAEMMVANTTPAHRHHARYRALRDRLREQLQSLRGQEARSQLVAADNPVYAQLVDEREGVLQQLEGERVAIAEQQASFDRMREELEKLPAIYQEYREKLATYEQARAAVLGYETERQRLDASRRVITDEGGYRILEPAYLPPRPTEPNITLVALAGSALGLAVAIALILLLDALRSTFKTVDDVERGLPVPVLGSMSWYETVEERQATRSSRRRIALVCALFLLLLVALVTLYYVVPTRLPGPVRSVLDLLLGGAK
jgi:uncharacterized protein involved in exopolysaccharide biosynthesis